MIDRRELLLLAAASAVAPSAARGAPAHEQAGAGIAKGTATRASEVRALRRFAEQTHPRGREAAADMAWRQSWDKLEKAADRLADGPYVVETRRALSWFEDGHTTILPFEFIGHVPPSFTHGAFGLALPWKVKLFDDGAFVVATTDEYAGALGARIDHVGRLSTAALMKAFDATWAGNKPWSQHWGALALTSPAQLHALGATSDPAASLSVSLAGSQAITLKPVRGAAPTSRDLVRKKAARELWAETAGRGNYVRPLPERNALYVSIDNMADVDGLTFEQLAKDVFAAMDSPGLERLIIDLRRNGGGDNFLGEALRKHIERSRFNRPGGLCVLTGPATFSAAQNLTNRLERETFALFVGGPTGLSPNHYGDAKMFTGPATGLMAMVSTLPWFDSYPQDIRRWIKPDLPVPATFADWRDGRDPALELALSHRSTAQDQDWSSDRVFYYARESQKRPWTTFWS